VGAIFFNFEIILLYVYILHSDIFHTFL
jgi:hypothetical protein